MCLSPPAFFHLSLLLPPHLFFNVLVSSNQAEKVTTPAIRHISAEVVPMGPPPPPKPKQTRDSTFMEKLHAVDEELASSPVCMDSFQVNIILNCWESQIESFSCCSGWEGRREDTKFCYNKSQSWNFRSLILCLDCAVLLWEWQLLRKE